MTHNDTERGMSLIELLVGLAIVSLMLGLVTASLNDLFETNIKKGTARLASTLKYLHNKAVTERVYLRVVFDIDKQNYWVESSDEIYVIDPEAAQKEAEKTLEEREKEEEEEEEDKKPSQDSHFSKEDSYLLKPVKLSEGVFFKDIQPSYIDQKIEQGQAHIYFFPNGYATPAVINFRDEDDEINYSLEIKAYSGRVRITSEYKELEKEEE